MDHTQYVSHVYVYLYTCVCVLIHMCMCTYTHVCIYHLQYMTLQLHLVALHELHDLLMIEHVNSKCNISG